MVKSKMLYKPKEIEEQNLPTGKFGDTISSPKKLMYKNVNVYIHIIYLSNFNANFYLVCFLFM